MYEYIRNLVTPKAIWNTLHYNNLFIIFAPMFVSQLQLNIVHNMSCLKP